MKSRLIQWLALPAIVLAMGLVAPLAASAQDDDYDELYEETYEKESDNENVSLGIGIGLVKPDGDGEIYYSAALRFRIGNRGDDSDRNKDREASPEDDYNRRHNARHYRGGGGGQGDGIRGYLEPEIGYWSRTANDPGEVNEEDLYVGLNLVGVVPTRNADFFFGAGFGLHFTDTQILNDAGILTDESESRLGGNIQTGVDINISDSFALYGLGRLDLLEDRPNDRQSKVQVGIRFKF